MRYIADLHIHSRYSRATSKDANIYSLTSWALIKGAHVIGTGDFTHPLWFNELQESLQPAEPGFFRLKNSPKPLIAGLDDGALSSIPAPRFVLSAEISSIYSRNGRVRKVHNLLYVPDFASAARINAALARVGNLNADGRPILGLDSRNLLEIVLEQAPQGFLVPAHIWTPWFSLFGSKSGFDSIEECYGDLSSHVFALETGLSSDPAMNRRISALDRFTLISSSDCHSPAKICREATIFDTDFDYYAMKNALQVPVDKTGHRHLAATIEFFPEEGKYFHDGHRQCHFRCTPQQTKKLGGICTVCGKPLTVGVLSRVEALADRQKPNFPPNAPAVHSLIPLQGLLSELLHLGSQSKTVVQHYFQLIHQVGSELSILMDTPVVDLSSSSIPRLGEAITRMRENMVRREPGYDGKFGVIRVFD